jgi:hypothetical protein
MGGYRIAMKILLIATNLRKTEIQISLTCFWPSWYGVSLSGHLLCLHLYRCLSLSFLIALYLCHEPFAKSIVNRTAT